MFRNLAAVGVKPGDIDTETKWPEDPDEVVLNDMDSGALINELSTLKLLPGQFDLTPYMKGPGAESPGGATWMLFDAIQKQPAVIEEGTWRGTRLALTKIYGLIEQRYMSVMDVAQVDPIFPSRLTMQQRRKLFQFTQIQENGKTRDGYPPHLDLNLHDEGWDEENTDQSPDHSPFWLFNWTHLGLLKTIMLGAIPRTFVGTPDVGTTIAKVEDYNREQLQRAREHKNRFDDIFKRDNVGDLSDWTNPTTIERASDDWINHFIHAAKTPGDIVAETTITQLKTSSRESLYMQDYSYFRTAAGLKADDDIKCEFEDLKTGKRHIGDLYPLAIVTDWRGSPDNSVTIYNRRLFKRTNIWTGEDYQSPESKKNTEVDDWPWRYAKTCVQCSDWFRHEVTVHLTRTHLIEEAIIVAANRTIDPKHPLFRMLRPHWQKTLALNRAARDTLVPSVILEIVGFKKDEALEFICNEYTSFKFKESYVPNDLRNRGFPPEKLNDPKFHKYAYARCINSMWNKIRAYVEGMLSLIYPGPDADQQVCDDKEIQDWAEEMRYPLGANLSSFPTVGTFQELVDCVTMCIHIASPQHTAVNYLQHYYQGFVINKPSCLFAEPPTSLEELIHYTEDDLVKALPMNHPREWLLSSHVPYLLSFKPNQESETLIGCIATMYNIYGSKPSPTDTDKKTREVIGDFYRALQATDYEFKKYADDVGDKIAYDVLDSKSNAVSILI
ncbi:Lipoxygenase [Penicillium expansum]|nr:Lipoxygenase [Penicillium expansum]